MKLCSKLSEMFYNAELFESLMNQQDFSRAEEFSSILFLIHLSSNAFFSVLGPFFNMYVLCC